MKITIELPHDVIGGFINLVCGDRDGIELRCKQLGSDELVDGNFVKWSKDE